MTHRPSSSSTHAPGLIDTPLTRRRFVQGLALGGAALSLGLPRGAQAAAHPAAPAVLQGKDIALRIGAQAANFTGRPRSAVTVNGALPAPILRLREGEHVHLRVTNTLDVTSSIHWHGILLPADMDGVPGLSFEGIAPGATYDYHFPLKQSGTYWYHGHSAMQEQLGLYGALIIEPQVPEPFHYDRDHVVLLSDWTDTDPHRIFDRLKKQGDYFNFRQRTVADFFRDVKAQGWKSAWADRKMWGAMRMNPTDLADVSAAAYTYLVNGATPASNWTGLFKPGEKVRLRFINGAAMTYFDIRIPGLKMTVVAADGQLVQPVQIEEFRLGVAETLDVIVEPGEQQAYTIFAQNMDRSGFARATLATQAGLSAPVPAVDARPLLSMADMGHGSHGAHDAPAQPAAPNGHAGHGRAAAATVPDAHAGHGVAATSAAHDARSGHGAIAAAHDEHAGHGAAPATHDAHAGHGAATTQHPHAGHDMGSRLHENHDGSGAAQQGSTAKAGDAHATHGSAGTQSHPASETGNPGVDMQAETPTARLDDPGVGLRDNGRRVLTYADLKSRFPDPDGRAPSRDIELHLTGHMERYVWSFNGVRFGDAAPLVLQHGERVRIILVNDTMMEHPIHLHGMWSDLEDEDGNFQVRKHTISMPPGTRRSYRVTAEALGRWAYHCHLLFHMDSGMFREVRVVKGGTAS
jgi:CopA family copper-resistance protein